MESRGKYYLMFYLMLGVSIGLVIGLMIYHSTMIQVADSLSKITVDSITVSFNETKVVEAMVKSMYEYNMT